VNVPTTGPAVLCSAKDDVADIARRASDALECAGREREAYEMRLRFVAALGRACPREVLVAIVREYVEVLPVQ
jgi:hypothetical protein